MLLGLVSQDCCDTMPRTVRLISNNNNKNIVSHGWRGWKPKIKDLVDSVSDQGSFPSWCPDSQLFSVMSRGRRDEGLSRCITYIFHCYDKTPGQKQLITGDIYLGF